MRPHPKLSLLFLILALLLSHAMCAVTAAEYASLFYCGKYGLCSAPPTAAFLFAVPFLAGILIFLGLAHVFRKR